MKKMARLFAAAAALAVAGTLAACGGGSSTPAASGSPAAAAPTTVNTSAPLYAKLPQAIKDKGSIQVGASIEYAPMEYYDTDGKTVIGFDKELSDLLSQKLGVPFVWNGTTFDGLITQLTSNRLDTIISAMTDNPERQKEVDFVDYYRAGMVMLVQKGNPKAIATVEDLCGKTVAVQRGTSQDQYIQTTLQDQCKAAGKPQINLLAFDTESQAMLQVKQGRADSGMQDYPVAAYNVKQGNGAYETAGEQVIANPLGIAVRKSDTELRDVLQQAVQQVMDDGSYQQLIAKYDTPQGAIDKATINAGK
ncbi:ABC transporter substrate-binding protein [Raineyella sp. LH-20]|uniref:ABC transporter substrate-binding protein n=1 Tax=Raineyella sp. LH-20 TaxID=3081204 RepID=UPI0029556D68|nr:ABC transporter substrate-binding protein [Raineyella sp. LH-20]WOP18531.1 ABC transporter substrate-binding protein [Raineyella sp. LH-20]